MYLMLWVALDEKHVVLKKPKKTGALYHNYKGFFAIVMLALVDGEYKFRWVDAGTAGSCLDVETFTDHNPPKHTQAHCLGLHFEETIPKMP